MSTTETEQLGWPPEVVRAAFAANADLLTVAARELGGEVRRSEAMVCAATGSVIPFFNQGCAVAPLGDPDPVIREALAFFTHRQLPFTIALLGSDARSHASAEDQGLRLDDEQPLMLSRAADLASTNPPPSELEIRRTSPGRLDEHVGAAMPPGARESYRSLLSALLEVDGFHLLCGYLDGRGVATSAAYVSRGLAGIFAVGTAADVRGRGIGEAITMAAARAACVDGVDTAFLFSSRMGLRIYERMGFRRVASHRYYVGAP